MQEQPSAVDLAQLDDEAERLVLELLLAPGCERPWSMRELGLALGNFSHADVAVVGLHAAGLVHRCHEFVWASRPAARLHMLVNAV